MLEFLIFIFFSIPFVSFVWFLVSLIRFLIAPKYSEKRETSKQHLFIATFTISIFFFILFSLFILFGLGIANM